MSTHSWSVFAKLDNCNQADAKTFFTGFKSFTKFNPSGQIFNIECTFVALAFLKSVDI